MSARNRGRGFSLMEVVLAVGLFAIAVTALLALLPTFVRQGTANLDRLAAARLADAFKVELSRVAASGFDGLAGRVPVLTAPPGDGLAFVATRGDARVQERAANPASGTPRAAGEPYFLVECWRFPDGPLRYDATKACLPLLVRISWPGSTADANGSAATGRGEITFVVSLRR